jgi:hypothetical protein
MKNECQQGDDYNAASETGERTQHTRREGASQEYKCEYQNRHDNLYYLEIIFKDGFYGCNRLFSLLCCDGCGQLYMEVMRSLKL